MSNNLRELTGEHHKSVERSSFVRRIIKKTITPREYHLYMCNQLLCYDALEYWAEVNGVFDGIENIKRTSNIFKDVHELELQHGYRTPIVTQATLKYIEYINTVINNDPQKLLAHVYVRHMGDMSGGQILKKLVPGSGHHYVFDGDIDTLKENLRSKLHDGLADEAKICFDMVGEIFVELEDQIGSMESTD